MYSMVLMAALTTGTDMPDMGRRGGRGGCCGCYGGMGYGGCYGGWGGGYGGCMGMGYGGCMGMGWGGGWGGCYGGGWGGCYGGGYGRGGHVWGGGYGGNYVLGGVSPFSGYAMTPMTYGSGVPLAGNTTLMNPGTQSFYFNPGQGNQGNVATIVVHLPPDANLTIDGEATRSRSATRVFTSPPLESGKTFTYTLQADVNRDGRQVKAQKTVEVQAGRRAEVDLTSLGANDRDGQGVNPNPNGRNNAPAGNFPVPPQ